MKEAINHKGFAFIEVLSQCPTQSGRMIYGNSDPVAMFNRYKETSVSVARAGKMSAEELAGKIVVGKLHQIEGRAEPDRPFIAVNCAAVPRELMESELFGHVRGAFTGAVKDKPGLFELAHGGTLFLAEIAELPLELQPKLLRAVEQGELQRVGGSRPVPFHARILAATNRDLKAEVTEGRFRGDLYYRIRVVEISL